MTLLLNLPKMCLNYVKRAITILDTLYKHTVGNKAKGQISKRVFQEHKARQIFRKRRLEMFVFRKIWCALCS